MLSSNVSGDDLFIVSDYNVRECKSKKLDFHQLNASIASSNQVKQKIKTEINDAVNQFQEQFADIAQLNENSSIKDIANALSAILAFLKPQQPAP